MHTAEGNQLLNSRDDYLSKIRYLARAFENSMMGMTLLDCEGRWIEVNPAFCELLGRTRDELIGATPNPHTHPDDLPHCLKQRSRLVNAEISGFQTEQRYIHADGHEIWVRLEALIIHGENRDPDLIMTQVKDITSRHQMRQALADSEARLQAIIRSMGEGVMVYDLEGKLILSNDRAAEIFAMTPAQLIASDELDDHWEVSHPDGRHLAVDEYPAIITLRTGKPQRETVLRVKKTDGRHALFEVNTEPVRIQADGGMIAVVATFSDITERTRTQAALAESEERLSLALEGARLGMWDWHLDADQIRLNSTATRMINHGESDLEYRLQNIVAMIHKDDRRHSLNAMTQHLNRESAQFNIDVRLFRVSDRYVWVNLRGRVTETDEQGRPVRVSGILMDIDDRKQLLNQLEILATTDPLTELYNRRFGSEALEHSTLQSNRQKQPFSLILIDVDHFKQINDEFGHDAGDRVLINIATLLKQRTRETDFTIRWGGEEFAILMPTTSMSGAETVAQNLLKGIQLVTRPDGKSMSISIGVTEYRLGESVNELLKRADHLMYEAKKAGRGRMISG